MSPDLSHIRTLIIQAIASDEILMSRLVLKGGNALSLVHRLDNRKSLDIDFSVADDFADLDSIEQRIFSALEGRFKSEGFKVFDKKFYSKPSSSEPDSRWGGYEVEFKLIAIKDFDSFAADPRSNSVRSISVGDLAKSRKFSIQISKYEWISDSLLLDLDGVQIRVYTLPMIAIEKLRALCQQMDGYKHLRSPRPRARDFFDIFQINQRQPLNLDRSDRQEIVAAIFAAKEVPLHFMDKLINYKSFHEADWAAVRASATGPIEPFQFYFDFVCSEVAKLKPLWDK